MIKDEAQIYPVRGYGFSVVHGARLLDSQVRRVESAYTRGYNIKVVTLPVVSLCGVRIRSYQPVVVIMQEGVRCWKCRQVMQATEETEVRA